MVTVLGYHPHPCAPSLFVPVCLNFQKDQTAFGCSSEQAFFEGERGCQNEIVGTRWHCRVSRAFLDFFGVMPVKILPHIILVALLIAVAACSKHRLEPEIYIPSGMPVTIDVSRDDPAPETIKYIVRPRFDPDIKMVSLWFQTIKADGTFYSASGQIKFQEVEKSAGNGSYSWNETDGVSRFLVIVLSVQTVEGIWVPDIPDIRQFPINEIVKKGAAALPKAKFYKNDG